ADGTEKSAEYKVDGSKVTVVDPTTGETKETTMDADGTHATVKDKDGNPTKSADYTADGSTVKAFDPTTGQPTAESKYGADGLSTKAFDENGNVKGETTVTPEGVNLYGKDGKDGKDAEPVASLTNKVDADGKNNPSLAFAKDGKGDDAKGTGSVTGLKDIERNLDGTAKDRTAAANAGYVDDRLKEMNDGKPFEYFDKDGNQVVRGKDGKFYDPKALEGKVYDPETNQYYPAKADGTADTAQAPVATGKPASDVVIKAMPNEAGPVAMGNVGSGLGLDAYNGKPGADGKTVPAKYDATNADDVKAAQGAADKLYALDGDKLNNVVTAGDLQALAVAGLDFTGNNNGTTVHRALGSKLTVEGEGAWNGQNSAADNLYVQADAANNKLVVKMNENLTGINSVDFKPTEITNSDGSKTYAKSTISSAGNTYVETDKDGNAVANGKSATYGLNGSSLADGKGNVTNMTAAGTNVVDAAGNTANYGANGSTVADAAGNTANYGANGLTVADKDGNPAITLVNNASGPSLNFAKNADGTGTGKITGVAAGDISPDSTDVVTGAQVYALSGGNTVTINPADGSTTSTAKDKDGNIIMTTDENGNQVEKQYTLTTYNVEGQTEFVTNSVITAVHNMNEQGIKFFHTNDAVATPINQASNSIDSSASGAYATAVGYQAKADGTNAIAMGKGATAAGENSIAIGTGNQVLANKAGAFGDPNIIEQGATGSYAIGNDNVITSSNTFVLGNDVNNSGNVNGQPVAMGNTVENSVYLGNKSTATAGDGSRTGTLKNRKQDGSEGTTTTAGSTGTVSSAKVGNMTYGGFAGAKADGVVSVGAAGNERRVQNVAAGEISATSTDAINGSQLYSVAQGVDKLDGKVNRMNRKLRSGIAAATAMTNIPQVTMPGKSALGAGVGSYDGQGALAVGYSRMSDSGRVIFKVSAGATTQGKYNAGAGVALQW
ncbi:YadA family autotransporter adhesin, partial [Actinobacillus minor]|uniref:YadA family autotransporter adhesin n=1 Tax=Actinobacillus minor TaxID=51047 RepID=UPI0023F0D4EA